jgi:hypothetical protein
VGQATDDLSFCKDEIPTLPQKKQLAEAISASLSWQLLQGSS